MIPNRCLQRIAFATGLVTLGACRPVPRDLAWLCRRCGCGHRQGPRADRSVAFGGEDGGRRGRGRHHGGHDGARRKRAQAAGAHVLAWRRSISGAYPAQPAGIAPGEAPGANYPVGTVYLARAENEGIYVTEWDLAANAVRRRLELVGAKEQGPLRLWRVGDALHVVLWAINGLASDVRLALGGNELAGNVSPQGPAAIAADANVTVVIFDGEERTTEPPGPDQPHGLIVASFDARGRPLGKRILQRESYLAGDLFDNAAVLGDRAFVLLRTEKRDVLKLVLLGRHLDIENTITLQTPLDRAAMPVQSRGLALFAWHDHLFIRSPDAPLMVELAPAGNELRRFPACGGPVGRNIMRRGEDLDFWLQGEHVTLRDPDWIEWSEAGAGIGSMPEPCEPPPPSTRKPN